MKELMTVFGAFFFASVVLTSCGDVNIEDLDKDIESEEDAVEAMLTLGEAQLNLMESLKGPLQEIANLKDRSEEITEALQDVNEQIYKEDLDWDDIREEDDMEDMQDKILDMMDEIQDLLEDCEFAYEGIYGEIENREALHNSARDARSDRDYRRERGSSYMDASSASGSASGSAVSVPR